MRVAIVGSLNYDLVTRAERVPDGGETVHAKDFKTFYGGKGANEAVAVRKLSPAATEVVMVGSVGKDAFGKEILEHLRGIGVNISHVAKSAEKDTGIATILVDDTNDNRILVYPGANQTVSPESIPDEVLASSDYILLQNEIPMATNVHVLQRISELKQTGKAITTVYNPSPIDAKAPNIWKLVDILVVNEGEAASICELTVDSIDEATDAAAALVQLGVGTAIITMGPLGAVWASKTDSGHIKGVKVTKLVDTTCAGDTFLGALVSQLAIGKQLTSSLEFANNAAAIAVTRAGAQASIPTLEELD